MTLANLGVRRLTGGRAALNQAELMLLYSVLSLSSVVAGVGHTGFFLPFPANPFYYANGGNGWRGFWHLLPPYIGPCDPAVLHSFYQGHSTFFQPFVMRAWILPLCVWSGFFLVLLWTTLCLAAIVRQRWSEEEHLPFPVVVLPPYCSHLNLIETLWRHIKYRWLDCQAYQSFETLCRSVTDILAQVGTKHRLSFV